MPRPSAAASYLKKWHNSWGQVTACSGVSLPVPIERGASLACWSPFAATARPDSSSSLISAAQSSSDP